jgi:RNA polymerase sigma factor (sigma-70 family)
VAATLTGNREAFSQIVSRYQSLICSLAYSATGSLGQSEDLAQETFITAWKRLRLLREPSKLRAWLCGIARNRIHSRSAAKAASRCGLQNHSRPLSNDVVTVIGGAGPPKNTGDGRRCQVTRRPP